MRRMGTDGLSAFDREMLMDDLARRSGSAKELAQRYVLTLSELQEFVDANRTELTERRETVASEVVSGPEEAAVVTPTQLDQLWIANKFQRMRRYEAVADLLYKDLSRGRLAGSDLSTAAREFRSYAMLAANELGQLLHRGAGDSGDGDTLSIDITGVDMGALK
jgi:hypothetical protein